MKRTGTARSWECVLKRYVAPAVAVATTIGWMGVTWVFLGSAEPPTPEDAGVGAPAWVSFSLLGHLLLFGVLGFLVAVSSALVVRLKWTILDVAVAVLVGGLWGAFSEWYQTTVPARSGSLDDVVIDVVIDVLGAFLGGLAAWLGRRWITRHYLTRGVSG